MRAAVVVVAKAPVSGQAKTRLAAAIGDGAAADLAAAALLDTLSACAEWAGPEDRLVAMAGDLDEAARGDAIRANLRGWRVVPQCGATFADRLIHAHQAAASIWGENRAIAQIGSDTPQVSAADLAALSWPLRGTSTGCDAVLGPAADGGWWGLATGRAGLVELIRDVAMSQSNTGDRTAAALEAEGATVRTAHVLRDVDLLDDARVIAAAAPRTLFAHALVEYDRLAT